MTFEEMIRDPKKGPLEEPVPGGGFTGIFQKITVVGDSLSAGEMQTSPGFSPNRYHEEYDYAWGAFIARDTGARVNVFARGGMTAEEYCELYADHEDYWNRLRASQAYIIALGVNDLANGRSIPGTPADIDPEDWHNNKKTFCGYYGEIISRYLEIEPHARFFLLTAPKTDPETPQHKMVMDLHADMIREIAKLFPHTYVIDLRKDGPVYDEEFHRKFYQFDHLNAAGYLLTARMIESYIDWIVRSHMEDFSQASLIGSSFYDESLEKRP